MSDAVFIVDACRTPIGRFRGGLARVRPDDLAALVVGELVRRNPGVPPETIEEVWLGATNQAGEDNRNVARMAVLLAGLPLSVAGATVNRLCGSGLEAVQSAAAAMLAGRGELMVAGGVESMSRAPFVMAKPDEPLPRRADLVDTSLGWRLVNPRMPDEYTVSLGQTAEVLAREFAIEREEQDELALASHRKAVAAADAGWFDPELVPVPLPGPEAGVLAGDEGPRRDTDLDRLARLQPAFAADGTVTAGNSSALNDGAAAVLLATGAALERYALDPLARVVHGSVAGVEPHRMGIGPVPAMRKALDRAGWCVDDLAVVELNEAFAAQALAVLRELPIEPNRVNPRGGAIAVGHPIGCSGARIVTTLVHQLAELPPGTRAAATMCIGVGQGIAMLVERV
ncbi:MAG: thiolase family protein [Acidimicrobiia bacterium]